jgi:hypothetical protein
MLTGQAFIKLLLILVIKAKQVEAARSKKKRKRVGRALQKITI